MQFTQCGMFAMCDVIQISRGVIRRNCLIRTCVVLVLMLTGMTAGTARDDGRYANSPLRAWFEHLSSARGLCCKYADGSAIEDPDWKMVSDPARLHVHYRVRINRVWIDVPDDSVISEPNLAGHAMVWTVTGDFGMSIRCFMPGNMS